MKIEGEGGVSSHNIKIVANADSGVAYDEAIAGALRMSDRTGMPVELTHNSAKVLVDWKEAVRFFAHQLREERKP